MFSVRRTVRRIYMLDPCKSSEYGTDFLNVTIRRGMGKDIDAACGQLRKAYMESQET